jgi:hypothetical protein
MVGTTIAAGAIVWALMGGCKRRVGPDALASRITTMLMGDYDRTRVYSTAATAVMPIMMAP